MVKMKKLCLIIAYLILTSNSVFASNLRLELLIEKTERRYLIPAGLLSAIAKIESGTKAHALNIGGKALFASNDVEAIEYIEKARVAGVKNIDVGVMQLNYRWHGEYFANIQEMLEPQKNIEYAAIFLMRLKKRHGSWYNAIKYYHSSEPERQYTYSSKVVKEWGKRYNWS